MTFSPTIVTGTPRAKTSAAASGSTNALNSASGRVLPRPVEPPIHTSSATVAGACSSSVATFVSGPVATSVAGPGGGEELDGRARVERHRRLGQRRAVEPAGAVDVERGDELASARARRARGDRHAVQARERGHPARVQRRLGELRVARHRRDRAQIGASGGPPRPDRERVVVARVAVQDEPGHRGSSGESSPAASPRGAASASSIAAVSAIRTPVRCSSRPAKSSTMAMTAAP